MYCYIHTDRPAVVGTCVSCGKFICQECNTEINQKNYCKNCVSEIFNENKKKIEKLEDNKQPMVFMNAGGGGGGSSSSSSSSSAAASGSGLGLGVVGTPKNRIVAAILAILLGGLGAHKFYLDRAGQGILYLIFCFTFIPSIIGIIEGIIYLLTSDEAFDAKYGVRRVLI